MAEVRYLAVDPGVTTGYCLASLPENWRELGAVHVILRGKFQTGELDGDENRQISLLRNLSETCETVVVEDFILRERTMSRSLLAPVRLTSALRFALYDADFPGEIRVQSPSSAKSVVTDLRLRNWDLWVKGSPHERDAVRHMVLLLRHLKEERA